MVVISHPSAWTPSTVHDFTDSPSSSTVHAPHEDVSQPTFVPVSPSRSRRTYTRSSRGSSSRSCSAPLTLIETRITAPSFRPGETRGASINPHGYRVEADTPGRGAGPHCGRVRGRAGGGRNPRVRRREVERAGRDPLQPRRE